jgi:hypothetical protein
VLINETGINLIGALYVCLTCKLQFIFHFIVSNGLTSYTVKLGPKYMASAVLSPNFVKVIKYREIEKLVILRLFIYFFPFVLRTAISFSNLNKKNWQKPSTVSHKRAAGQKEDALKGL